jgi:hypothetical protein
MNPHWLFGNKQVTGTEMDNGLVSYYEVEVTEQLGEYGGPHYVVTCPTCKQHPEWTENGLEHDYQRTCGCGLLWRVEIRAIGERP